MFFVAGRLLCYTQPNNKKGSEAQEGVLNSRMPLAVQAKNKIISEHRTHKNDVGSSEVQVALLSRRISDLTEHLKQHNKDFSSRRGMLKMVNRRRRLLRYLRGESPERYRNLVQTLGLRG